MRTVSEGCYVCTSDVKCKAAMLCLYLRCMWENQEVCVKITSLSVKAKGIEFTGLNCALSVGQIQTG